MDERKTAKIFISYAHADKLYFDQLKAGIERHSKHSAAIEWETWDDTRIPVGLPWHQAIKEQIQRCDFAILLVSSNFLYSDYIKQEEFSAFIERQREDGFLFFPIMLGPCDFNQWPELGERQFFKPSGDQYGRPEVKNFTYADLVMQRASDGEILSNPNRDRYHMDLVKALEKVMREYAARPAVHDTRPGFFKTVKSGAALVPADIFVSRRRAETNVDFYWQRESDDRILAALKKNRSLLILGNPLAGKTRALLEALKKLENTTVLFPFDKPNPADFALPAINGRCVAVFDDIDEFLGNYTKPKLEELIEKLWDADVVIAATCRRGDEYYSFASSISDKIRGEFDEITIEKMDKAAVAAFKKYYDEHVSSGNKEELDDHAFDHNLGSYFMKLTAMSDRFRDLELKIKKYPIRVPVNLPREILKGLKYFYYTENMTGKSRFSMDRIKDFCERRLLGKGKNTEPGGNRPASGWQSQWDRFSTRQGKKEFTPGEWNNALKILSETEYELNFIEIDEPEIAAEEVYLERVVEKEIRLAQIIRLLENTYPGDDLRAYGFMTTVFAFTRLLNSVKTLEEGYNILDKMKSLGIEPDVVTFNTLVNKAPTFAEGQAVVESMRQSGVPPDVVTFTTLVNKAPTFAEGQAVVESMKKEGVPPNVVTFTTLVNKAHTFAEGLAVVESMRQSGVPPDVVTYNTLVDKAPTYAEGLAVVESMKKAGVKPDKFTYNTLVNKAHTYAEGLAVVESMRQSGVPPDVVTFNSLVNKALTFAEGQAVVESMKQADVPPDVVTFNSLVNKAPTFAEGLAVVESMKKEGVIPNVVTFTTLMNKAPTFAEGQAVVESMKKAGVPPNVVTFNSLVNKAPTFAEGQAVVESMKPAGVPPNVVTYTSLIKKAPTYAEAVTVLETMKRAGVKPDEFTHTTLKKIARRDPRATLETLFSKYPAEKIFADFVFYQIIAAAANQDPSCLELIIPHQPVLCRQEDAVLLRYARLFADHHETRPALELLECMKVKNDDYFDIKADCQESQP